MNESEPNIFQSWKENKENGSEISKLEEINKFVKY